MRTRLAPPCAWPSPQLTGNHETPLAKVTYTNEFCLQSGCHAGAGIMPGASESSTKDLAFDPHSDFHGVQQCNSCHRMHDQSVFTCAGCHQVGAWEGEGGIPEGWTKQDLGDGQQGAVPDGWTTPFLFEAAGVNFGRLRLSTKKGRAFGLALFSVRRLRAARSGRGRPRCTAIAVPHG